MCLYRKLVKWSQREPLCMSVPLRARNWDFKTGQPSFFFPQIKNILHFTIRNQQAVVRRTLKLTICQLLSDFSQFHKNKQWESETISNFSEDQYLMVFWKYAFNYWIAWIQLVGFSFKVWRSQKSKFDIMHTCTSLPIIFTFWQICISRNSES